MALSDPQTHCIYSIGWICPLPSDFGAAAAMLEQEHPSIGVPSTDKNNYTLGSIGDHNVVIVCLPLHRRGCVPAAVAASWLTSTFPNINCILLVGTGGGVPPTVKLGDVVISSSVARWDAGKRRTWGTEIRGWLNSPPRSILNLFTEFKANLDIEGSKILEYMEDFKIHHPELVHQYQRPKQAGDILFQPHYPHCEKSESGEETATSCQSCDKSMIVREIQPHQASRTEILFGLVASGEQVMKDALFRDQLKHDLGLRGDLLCFEMEAGGVINDFPCVTIRGISNYADSHKNDTWQNYASLAAACAAKELLLEYIIPSSNVNPEEAVGEALRKLSEIKLQLESITSILQQSQSRTFLDLPSDIQGQET